VSLSCLCAGNSGAVDPVAAANPVTAADIASARYTLRLQMSLGPGDNAVFESMFLCTAAM
jgi:hypothetical protein